MTDDSEVWDDYDDTDDCWECGGDGGWNSCMADCCPAIGGEEGCTDKHCWRICPNCRGAGSLPFQSSAEPNAVREPQANTDRIQSAKEAPNLPPCLGVAET